MSENLPGSTLLIISDTAVCKHHGSYFAFEPVLREIEAQAELFDKVIWLGSKVKYSSTVLSKVDNEKIKVVTMPSVRHNALNALFVLLSYPLFIFYILRYLPLATHIHTRAPSHPALIGILLCHFDNKRPYWHKYAGNWDAGKLSFTYNLQRSLLKRLNKQNIRITVNGNWNETNRQIISFENPCIRESERIQAGAIADKKDFTGALKLLFVGGLNIQKGVNELITAIESGLLPSSIVDIYIIGTGALFDSITKRVKEIRNIRIHLPGNLNRKELDEYYAASHILILPSISEGFPKVIAEAAAYGCIPVVTNVSSISQYINSGNGFILPDNKSDTIIQTLQNLPAAIELERMSRNITEFTKLFTYEYYTSRMKNEIWITNK